MQVVTLDDLAECRWDIAKFARLLGIEPHPGQVRIWNAMLMRDETAFRCLWLTIAVSAGNRAGKTLMLAIAVLHHTIFKIGLRPPDPTDEVELDRFSRLPYDWYHFGIQQEIGELLFHAIAQLLEGTHEAQRHGGCPLTDVFGRVARTDLKERGEYRWIIVDPVLGGGQIHFRTTAERGIGSLGKDMHGISFDECGFERNFSFVVNEVLHNRRMSTGGPMWFISTPTEGFTEFADEWKRGDPDNPLRDPDRISFRLSTRDNVGYGIDKGVFERIVRGIPPHLVPQNIDGYFIQGRKAFFDAQAVDRMFLDTLPFDRPPLARHRYVQGVDPAAVYDATWSIVLDATVDGRVEGVSVERRTGKQKVVDVAAMVRQRHLLYSSHGATCETALDTTGMGGKVFRQMLEGIHPLRSVEFGGTKSRKQRMLTDLKGVIEQGRLRFPREGAWLELRKQLLAYSLDDRDLDTDAVMTLAVGIKQVMRQMANARDVAPFDFMSATPSTMGAIEPRDLPAAPTDDELKAMRMAYRLKRATVMGRGGRSIGIH
jgi:hypothetical protein